MLKRILLLLLCLPLLSSAQNGKTLLHADHKIHYKTYGAGFPLLIINGGPGMNSNGFESLAKELSKNKLTILFDQRGTGKSSLAEVNSSTITMDLMVADIEEIRKDLGIEKWAILGHSFGGMLAAYYAAQHPETITGLILSSSGGIDMQLFSRINITSRLTTKQRDSLNYWNQQIANGDSSYHARLRRGKYLAPAYLYDNKHIPIIAERLTQGNMQINGLVFQDLRRIDFDVKQDLKKIKGPVLIIQGKEDIIDERTALETKEALPQAKIVILEYSGHYGWLDQEEKYYAELFQFLASLE